MINSNKQVITDRSHRQHEQRKTSHILAPRRLVSYEGKLKKQSVGITPINIHIVRRFWGDMRTMRPLCESANVELKMRGRIWLTKTFFNWMFCSVSPSDTRAQHVPPWQLKFPREIALTPTVDELGKYLEMSTIPDNAHISTSGQRTCLWRDEMEWKLFLTIIVTSQEFVQLEDPPSTTPGLVNISAQPDWLSPIKIFNLLQIELHFSSLTLLLTVAKYLDFFWRRKEILRNLLLSGWMGFL